MELIAPFGAAGPRPGDHMRHRREPDKALASQSPEHDDPLPNVFITLRVQEAFAADPALLNAHIAVETFEGIVQLSGSVRWRYELSRAKQVAWCVGSVRGVRCCIRLARPAGLPSTVGV